MTFYNDILPEDPTDAEWLRPLDAAVLQKVPASFIWQPGETRNTIGNAMRLFARFGAPISGRQSP